MLTAPVDDIVNSLSAWPLYFVMLLNTRLCYLVHDKANDLNFCYHLFCEFHIDV